MLERCAPGATLKPTDHHISIVFNGRMYRRLPLGAHGRKNPEIQVGHIKKMARHLEILDCAMEQLALS